MGGAEERLFLVSAGGGRGAAGGGASPTAPSRAWEAGGRQRRGTQGNNGDDGEGERAPPDKGHPSPAPGVSSFLQVLRFTPSKEAQQGSGTGVGEGSWTDPGDTPTHMRGLAFLQVLQQSRNLPPSSLCPSGSLQRLPDTHQGSTKDQGLAKSLLFVAKETGLGFSQARRGLCRVGLCLLQWGPAHRKKGN